MIGQYPRAGVLEQGKVKRSAKGTPQGGPLSPLLANVYLDRLAKELDARGIAFARNVGFANQDGHYRLTPPDPWIGTRCQIA